MAVELVHGPTAGQFDLWRRILNVASIALPIVVGLVLQGVGVPGPVLGGIMVALFVALFVAAVVVGGRVTQTMRREMEAGYSTLIDAADFELRDARTRELLRDASTAPEAPGSRSLLSGMFRVKPGTVLSKRIADDEK